MSYDPERITFFAKTDARGQNVPFGIKAKDRTRHVYVIGKTGMGKSTLLENMAVQDVQNGEGFAFIDPHGQTAETLLDYIPEERMKDVLYFAPHDMDFPVSFNIMEDVGPDSRHLIVSGLMSVFEKIWEDQWSARMAYILQNTLAALLEYPDSTLLGVNQMLSDPTYRMKVIENISDPAVKSFWVDEFLNYNERYMQEAGDAIKNKVGQFASNPLVRNIIGQPKSSFDIRKIMDEKKILIMNLSKGLIGETNANLLGSMLTTRIYLAAMSRADLSPKEMEQMPNFYFYVDEFQSFANATFANILSEARKYKLNLTIAHQYVEQMEEDVKNAVFGNVGTTISFRVGPFDAEVLETIFAPKFYAVDICNLGFAQIYLSLMIDGIGSQPFSAVTLPPIEPSSISCKDMIINSSRQQFSHSRTEVEAAITDWHESRERERKEEEMEKKRAKNERKRQNRENNQSNGSSNGAHGQPRQQPNGGGGSHKSRPHSQSGAVVRDQRRSPKNDSKNLDELRSVLAGLSKQEPKSTTEKKSVDSSPTHNSVPPAPKPAAASKPKDKPKSAKKPEGDLRGALAAVLKEAEDKKEKTSGNQKQNREVGSIKAKPDSTAGEKQSDLDPKQLERMMRVHTSDRTPLK